MRPVQLADVEMAARVLMRSAPNKRAALMLDLIREAEIADAHRQQFGTPHMQFGTGSLLSRAARCDAAPRPPAMNRQVLDAYRAVIDALLSHQKV